VFIGVDVKTVVGESDRLGRRRGGHRRRIGEQFVEGAVPRVVSVRDGRRGGIQLRLGFVLE